jgi:hypothetical protein
MYMPGAQDALTEPGSYPERADDMPPFVGPYNNSLAVTPFFLNVKPVFIDDTNCLAPTVQNWFILT